MFLAEGAQCAKVLRQNNRDKLRNRRKRSDGRNRTWIMQDLKATGRNSAFVLSELKQKRSIYWPWGGPIGPG